jgi:hypothetical protein
MNKWWICYILATIEALAIMGMAIGVSYLTGNWQWMWLLCLLLFVSPNLPKQIKEILNKDEGEE